MGFLLSTSMVYFLVQALLISTILKGAVADDVSDVEQEKDDLEGMDFLSEWSGWSRCSRTCGTGIQFRGRRCNRDRSPCLKYPRQHRTCNNKLCPVNALDFRDVQCSKENDRGVRMKGKKAKWKSIQRGTSKCMLFCHPLGHRMSFYFGRADDGTKCIDKPYSVCVAGKCTSVGCDRVLGSQKVFDRCQVCGGNGSSCEPYSGMIDREPTIQEKKDGYLKLFVIPEGATTILVSEVSHNYLAVQRQSGAFVFGGNKKMSEPGTYRVDNTNFQYSKLPNGNSEAIMIMGPTEEEFYVMALLTNKNTPKADYEYWLPKNKPTRRPKPVLKDHTPKHSLPRTTPGDLIDSSPSTPEQHVSTEYPTTAVAKHSSPNTQFRTTPSDLTNSSPSTPEQHVSTEYPTTATSKQSSPYAQLLTTPGDLIDSSPSTPQQHMSTEYPTTLKQTENPTTSQQNEALRTTDLPQTTAQASTDRTTSAFEPSEIPKLSVTPEQNKLTGKDNTTNTFHPSTDASMTAEQPTTTRLSVTNDSSATTFPPSPVTPTTTAHPTTTEQQSDATFATPSTTTMQQSLDSGDFLSTTFQSSPGTPSTTEHPTTIQMSATDSSPTTHHLTTTQQQQQQQTSTQKRLITEGNDGLGNYNQSSRQPTKTENTSPTTSHRSFNDSSLTKDQQPLSNHTVNITKQLTTTAPTSTQHTTTIQPETLESTTPYILNSTEEEQATTKMNSFENSNKTGNTSLTSSNSSLETITEVEGQFGEIGNRTVVKKNETADSQITVKPTTLLQSNTTGHVNKSLQSAQANNFNATIKFTTLGNQTGTTTQPMTARKQTMTRKAIVNYDLTVKPAITAAQNRTLQLMTIEKQNTTLQPTTTVNQNVSRNSFLKLGLNTTNKPTEQNATREIQLTTTGIHNVTVQPSTTVTAIQNMTMESIEYSNKTVQSASITNQTTTVRPTTTVNQTTTVQPTATESQNTTMQPTTTESQNTTMQPTLTESQNTTMQPTTTENQNTTMQSTVTESLNTKLQPTTTENQNTTMQSTVTQSQNTTMQPTVTQSQNTTMQPTTTQSQNTTMQPTTTQSQNTTMQPTTTQSQNTTMQPTTTQSLNTTMQPTTTENQNTTMQPTTTENQNTTMQPTTTQSQNTTMQPTTTQSLNTTMQPTTTENQNTTMQPTTTENQNTTMQPTTTENQNTTMQPTTTESQNTTMQPTVTESLNTTMQPTTTVNQTTRKNISTVREDNATRSVNRTEMTELENTSYYNKPVNMTMRPTLVYSRNVSGIVKNIYSIDEIQNTTRQPTTMNENATQSFKAGKAWEVNASKEHSVNTSGKSIMFKNNVISENITIANGSDSQRFKSKMDSTTEEPSRRLNRSETENGTFARENVTGILPSTENPTERATTLKERNTTWKPTAEFKIKTESRFVTSNKIVSGNWSAVDSQSTLQQTTASKANVATGPLTTPATVVMSEEDDVPTGQPATTTKISDDKAFIEAWEYTSTVKPTKKESKDAFVAITASQVGYTMSTTQKTTGKKENLTSEFMPWSQWTTCSRTCGLGFKVRARLCKQDKEGICSRNETQITFCKVRQCEKLVPMWSPWRPWSECSSQCGMGLRVRVRSCRNSKVMTLLRTGCVGRRYEIEICRSSEGCPSKEKPSNMFSVVTKSTMSSPLMSSCHGTSCVTPSRTSSTSLKESPSSTRTVIRESDASTGYVVIDNLITWSKSIKSLTASTQMSSSLVGGVYQVRGIDHDSVAHLVAFSTPSLTLVGITPSVSMSTSVLASTAPPVLSSITRSLSYSPSSSTPATSSSSSSSSAAAAAAAAASSPSPSPSSSLPSSSLPPPPSAELAASPSSSSSSPLPSYSSVKLLPVLCESCGATKSPSDGHSSHPLPTTTTHHMKPVESTPSTTVVQTPKLPFSSLSIAHTVKTSSFQKASAYRSIEDTFASSTVSKAQSSVVSSIKASRTVNLATRESSTRTQQGQTGTGSCPRCRTSQKKQKLFCVGDYAIHVQVKNGSLSFNNKTVYHLRVKNIYKSKQQLPKELFIRVTRKQCPCPRLETGKDYLVIGRARRTRKGSSKILINRRSFVREWNARLESEMGSLRNHCIALGFNMTSSYLTTTVQLKSKNDTDRIERPSTASLTATTSTTKYSGCPACVPKGNTSMGDIYCKSEYAIRARVTKYRTATNRTMFYAHLIKTYKTKNELPTEVLIRVPGEKCPCPRLVPGAEYLMIGQTKQTLTGKSRLTLTVENFYKEWREEFVKEIAMVKTKCGLPVVTVQPNESKNESGLFHKEKSTMAPTSEERTTPIPTENPTESTTSRKYAPCPSCDKSTIVKIQQKRFCKNENVFHGRVLKSFSTPNNRIIFSILLVRSFKAKIEMPDKILARMSENSCQCSHFTPGKDYLIMGQVKLNKKGKARMVLTRKSFIQEWNSGLIQELDDSKTKCGAPVVTDGSGPSVEPGGTPDEITTAPSSKTIATTVEPNISKERKVCPPCQVSANIHDFCSSSYVFRGRVLKGYHTSANRTVYHISVITSYKSQRNLSSVVLVRIPGILCPCPQLQVGVDYVLMGWVRVKKKTVSRMILLRKNFVQKWDGGFEEELSSLHSSCKTSVIDGPLVQSGSLEKDIAVPTTLPRSSWRSVTTKTTSSTIRSTTQVLLPTKKPVLTNIIEKACAPCQTSKKRNQLYCTSDYVITVGIEKKEHDPATDNTKYYAVVKNTFKERDPLTPLVTLWVLNNECSCPDLQVNKTYVIMANSDFGENGMERLVLSERSFVKEWTKGLQRRISKLKDICSTDHK